MAEVFDNPGAAQKPAHERCQFERGFDESIGAADDAKLAGQIDREGWRTSGIERQKADAAGKPFAVRGKVIEQSLAGRDHQMLRLLAKGDFDERRDFDAYLDQIGQ